MESKGVIDRTFLSQNLNFPYEIFHLEELNYDNQYVIEAFDVLKRNKDIVDSFDSIIEDIKKTLTDKELKKC